MAVFLRSRGEVHAFFAGLTDEQRERAGIHPERGHFATTDTGLQVGHHHTIHLERIAKTLSPRDYTVRFASVYRAMVWG